MRDWSLLFEKVWILDIQKSHLNVFLPVSTVCILSLFLNGPQFEGGHWIITHMVGKRDKNSMKSNIAK